MKKLILFLLFPLIVFSQTVDTLGITISDGQTDLSTNYIVWTKIPGDSVTTSGTLLTIGIKRQETGTYDQRFSIYSDNEGNPGTLLDTTLEKRFGAGWVYINVTEGINIVAGTTYWVGMKCSVTRYWYTNSAYTNYIVYEASPYTAGWVTTATNGGNINASMVAVIIVSTPSGDTERINGYGGYGGWGGY